MDGIASQKAIDWLPVREPTIVASVSIVGMEALFFNGNVEIYNGMRVSGNNLCRG